MTEEYQYLYIEFTEISEAKLANLTSLVHDLQKARTGNKYSEKDWLPYFSEESLLTFWWPNADQLADTKERWGDLPIKVSPIENNPQEDWDIYSMFEIILTSEYELEGVKEISLNKWHLAFNSVCYPYGGTSSLKRLVNAFDGYVCAIEDGCGREEFSKDMQIEKTDLKEAKSWWRFW